MNLLWWALIQYDQYLIKIWNLYTAMYIWKTYEDTRLRQPTPSQEERPIINSFL